MGGRGERNEKHAGRFRMKNVAGIDLRVYMHACIRASVWRVFLSAYSMAFLRDKTLPSDTQNIRHHVVRRFTDITHVAVCSVQFTVHMCLQKSTLVCAVRTCVHNIMSTSVPGPRERGSVYAHVFFIHLLYFTHFNV